MAITTYATVLWPFTNLKGHIVEFPKGNPAPGVINDMLSRRLVLSLWSSRNKAVGWLVVQFVTEFSYLAEIAREDGPCLSQHTLPFNPTACHPISFEIIIVLSGDLWGRGLNTSHSNFQAVAGIIATLFTKTTTNYCSRWCSRVRALTGHPYNLHWPFTDFGQIREDSGRDAGNLLQLPRWNSFPNVFPLSLSLSPARSLPFFVERTWQKFNTTSVFTEKISKFTDGYEQNSQ